MILHLDHLQVVTTHQIQATQVIQIRLQTSVATEMQTQPILHLRLIHGLRSIQVRYHPIESHTVDTDPSLSYPTHTYYVATDLPTTDPNDGQDTNLIDDPTAEPTSTATSYPP
jgi:hypothetical protein